MFCAIQRNISKCLWCLDTYWTFLHTNIYELALATLYLPLDGSKCYSSARICVRLDNIFKMDSAYQRTYPCKYARISQKLLFICGQWQVKVNVLNSIFFCLLILVAAVRILMPLARKTIITQRRCAHWSQVSEAVCTREALVGLTKNTVLRCEYFTFCITRCPRHRVA